VPWKAQVKVGFKQDSQYPCVEISRGNQGGSIQKPVNQLGKLIWFFPKDPAR
jgi:hypothetical protein